MILEINCILKIVTMGNDRYNWFYYGASQVVLVIKNLPAEAGDKKDPVQTLSWEVPLEKGMITCSSILVWRIPWIEALSRLQSMGFQSRIWSATPQTSLSFTISQSLLKFMSFKTVMLYNHLILCRPLLLLLSSASGYFPMNWLFASSSQSIGASASVLLITIQGWFPLGSIGLISLKSKGLSRVFASTTIESISSLTLSLLYGPTLTSIHDS